LKYWNIREISINSWLEIGVTLIHNEYKTINPKKIFGFLKLIISFSSLVIKEQYIKITIIPPKKIKSTEIISHWLIKSIKNLPTKAEINTRTRHIVTGCEEKKIINIIISNIELCQNRI